MLVFSSTKYGGKTIVEELPMSLNCFLSSSRSIQVTKKARRDRWKEYALTNSLHIIWYWKSINIDGFLDLSS